MLLVAVASATTAFAKTGETLVTAASRQEVSDNKPEAPLEALVWWGSCTVSDTVYNWDGSSTVVTTTTTCTCSGSEACAIATSTQLAYIAAMP